MKRILLMAAFAGMLGSAAIANTYGDDKDKGKKKECCSKKGAKACAGEKKEEGCAKGEAKACCKKKHAESSAVSAANAEDQARPADSNNK